MKKNDLFRLSLVTYVRNKKNILFLLIFIILYLFILVSITAYFSVDGYKNNLLKNNLFGRMISVTIRDKDILSKIRSNKNIIDVRLEYTVHGMASLSDEEVILVSFPYDYLENSEFISLEKGEVIVPNTFALMMDNKMITGKKLIGKKVSLNLDGEKITDLVIDNIYDSSKYMSGSNTVILSYDDMVSYMDIEEKRLSDDEFIDKYYVVFINSINNLDSVYQYLDELNLNPESIIEIDFSEIKRINSIIYAILLGSVFLYIFLKFLFTNNFYQKEKEKIDIYLTNGFKNTDIKRMYSYSNLLNSFFTILISMILFIIVIILYFYFESEFVSDGLIPCISFGILLFVWLFDILLSYLITLLNLKKCIKYRG